MLPSDDAGIVPILCAPLLRRVDQKLIELLTALAPNEWDLPTVAGQWTVRDVAAHLLDTALRKLSLARDSVFIGPAPLNDLPGFVNRLNREGVAVYRRLSPPVLIDLMQLACEQSACFHESLDEFAPAAFAVSWAGEETSLNWFDTARELTERWHHQQQIRLATDRPGIMTRELYYPVLDCFARGLPHLFQPVEAPGGTTLSMVIAGECGGRWLLARHRSGWHFVPRPSGDRLAAQVTIPQEIAWRVFTKGIGHEAARQQIQVEGDQSLGEKVLELTAIVA